MLRKLDQRNTAGMTITLEWDSATNRVFVTCVDGHAGHEPLLCYPVEPREARFAFLHPFAATPLRESRSVEGAQPERERGAAAQAVNGQACADL